MTRFFKLCGERSQLTATFFQTKLDQLNKEKQVHIPKVEHWNKKMEVDTVAISELQKELDIRIKYLEVSGSITVKKKKKKSSPTVDDKNLECSLRRAL